MDTLWHVDGDTLSGTSTGTTLVDTFGMLTETILFGISMGTTLWHVGGGILEFDGCFGMSTSRIPSAAGRMWRLYSWPRQRCAVFAVFCRSGKARAHFQVGMFDVPFPVCIHLFSDIVIYCLTSLPTSSAFGLVSSLFL